MVNASSIDIYFSLQTIEPQPDFFSQDLSSLRIISSRVLGEEEEEQNRKNISFEVLKVKKITENEELFSKSVIGVAHFSSSSNYILDQIHAKGVLCLKIHPLGGMLHLIRSDTREDKMEIIQSKWLSKWFIEIREVNDKSGEKHGYPFMGYP